MLETLILVAFIAAVDAVMGYFWFPPYYSIGLPLFYRVIPAPTPPLPPPSADQLRASLSSLDRAVSLASIGDGVFAFREYSGRGTSPSYTQLLHGHLSFNTREGTLSVIGLVNYFPVAFSAAIAAWTWTAGIPWASALPAVILVPIYLIQRNVYIMVADAAVRAWHASADDSVA